MSITIQDVPPRAHYVATEGQTVFQIPFQWLDNTDLRVWVNEVEATFDEPPLDAMHYSTTGVGTNAVGWLTFGEPGRLAGDEVIVMRAMPISSPADFPSTGVFPNSTLNDAFDELTAQVQQAESHVQQRALRVSDNDFLHPLLPIPKHHERASKLLGFDPEGQPIAVWFSDVVHMGPNGYGQYETQLAVTFANVEQLVQGVVTLGRAAIGDRGGGVLKRVRLDEALALGVDPSALIRSTDRWLPAMAGTDNDQGGWWLKSGPVITPEQFGTTWLHAVKAMNHAVLLGLECDFGFGASYPVDSGNVLNIPSNIRMKGDALFTLIDPAPEGTFPPDEDTGDPGSTSIRTGDNIQAEKLRFQVPGGTVEEISAKILLGGNNPRVDYLEVTTNGGEQRTRGGLEWRGTHGNLRKTVSRNVDRPLIAVNPDPEAMYDTDWRFGDMDFASVIRGFRPENMRIICDGDVNMRGTSPNAVKEPGSNGVLATSCPRIVFLRPLYIDGIKEHAFRAGGKAVVGDDIEPIELPHSFIHIAGLFVTNCDGCALKLNQNGQLSEYVWVGPVDGTDIGQDTHGHGEEMVRVAKARNGHVGPIISRRSSEEKIWPRAAVQLNNTQNFVFGPIEGNYRQQFVDVNGDGDIGSTFGAGPVEGCRFIIGSAETEGQTGFRFYGTRLPQPGEDPVAGVPTTAGDLDIVLEGAGGWTENMFSFTGPGWEEKDEDGNTIVIEPPTPGLTYTPLALTGLVRVFGEISGPIGPKNDIDLTVNPTADKILLNLGWQGRRVQGIAVHMRSGNEYLYQWQGAAANGFDPGDVPPTGLFVGSKAEPSGIGKMGLPIEFGRIGDNRRGAAIAPWQDGAESHNVGLRFYVGAGGGPSQELRLALSLDHHGNALFEGSTVISKVARLDTTLEIATMTIPASVDFIQTSGRVASGDRGHATLVRSATAKPGGVTDAGGNHWRIFDNPVRPAQFGRNTDPGVTNMTSALRLMSEYATEFWLDVDFRDAGLMLVNANALIEFDHPFDVTGLKLVLNGGIVGTPDDDTVSYVWNCVSAATPLLTGTFDISGDAPETKLANSLTLVKSLTLAIGTADGFTYVQGTAGQLPEIAGRHPGDPKYTYRQSFATIRGVALEPLSRDVAFTSLEYRSRANTTRGWLEIKGLRYDTALGNNQGLFLVQRNQVVVRDTVFDTSEPDSVAATVNRLLRFEDCAHITIDGLEAPAQQNPSSGTYVVSFIKVADIVTRGVRAIDGWGAFGTQDVNGWYAEDMVVNRIDGHGGFHNVYVDESTLSGIGIKYGYGGGVIKVANTKAINCPLISSRGDYGGYFYGALHADDCTLVSDAFQITAIDLATDPIGPDTIVAPCPDIHITNLRREGRDGATGSASELRPVAIAVRKAGGTGSAMGVEAPAVVSVEGVLGSGGWRFAMPIDYANMINSTQVSGNHHFCHVERVYPQASITVETQGIYVPPKVLAAALPGTVAFYLRDIRNCAFDALALDVSAQLFSADVQYSRCVLAGNTRAEIYGGVLGGAFLTGADTTTIFGGARTSGTLFSSLVGVIVRGAWDLSRVRSFTGVDIQDTSANNLVVLPTGCTRPAAKRGWQSKALYALQGQHIPDVTLAELATMPPASWKQHLVWVSNAAAGAGQLAFCNGTAWGVIAIGAAPA